MVVRARGVHANQILPYTSLLRSVCRLPEDLEFDRRPTVTYSYFSLDTFS